MNSHSSISRRQFLAGTAAAAATLAVGGLAQAAASPRFKIIAFSKPFQELNFEDTADLVADVGWDGIECPVRKKGQIEPERAAEELPKLVEALKKRGKSIDIITTNILGVDAETEALLRTAAKLGIPRYRLAYWKYDRKRPVMEQLDEIRPQLRELAALNQELGIQGCYQNHSGKGYVGAPVWDLHYLIQDLDPRHMAMCFDIGHATVEGGYAWETHAQLMEPHYGAVYIKDFRWEKTDKGWRSVWCPLGEGMVDKVFFERLKKSAFQGPISQHHEYDYGSGKEMLANFKRDLKVFQEWLA